MAEAAFIQGLAKEVKIADILPERFQTSSTKVQREEVAAKYEKEHPSVVVVRDWEEIPDGIIAQLTDEEQAQALSDRAALQDRRLARANVAEADVPEMGMDPDRAAKELKRQRANLAGLTVEHPDYDRIFATSVRVIHQLEDICEIPRTHFEKGVPTAAKAVMATDPELLVKLDKYKALPKAKRERSIMVGENVGLIRLIRDNEAEAELQDLAVLRLAQLEANF